MAKFLLSVVIPSYNEMSNLRKGTLEKVERYLDRQKLDYEVIIVDDGSTDGSREFVKDYSKDNARFKLVENSHTGKAGAVTTGMLRSIGDYVLFTDMDQATPISELEKLLPYTEKNYDIVIGSRSSLRKGAPFTRKIMSQGMMFLRSFLVGLPTIKDTQCGFKLFSREASRNVFEKVKNVHGGFKKIKGSSVTAGFDVELLYIAQNMKYTIKEVSVDWLYVESRRVSPLKDSIQGVNELLKIRRNIGAGIYK